MFLSDPFGHALNSAITMPKLARRLPIGRIEQTTGDTSRAGRREYSNIDPLEPPPPPEQPGLDQHTPRDGSSNRDHLYRLASLH